MGSTDIDHVQLHSVEDMGAETVSGPSVITSGLVQLSDVGGLASSDVSGVRKRCLDRESE